MARAIPEALFYYSADEGVDPASSALGAWTKEGTFSPTFVSYDGVERLRIQGAGRLRYLRTLVESDGKGAGPERSRELIEVQAYVRGLDQNIGWDSDASPFGFVIYDGVRGYMLAIGDLLALCVPDTGEIVKVLQDGWDWSRAHSYRFRKEHAGRLEVWVDGRLLGTAPPAAFPALTTDDVFPARAGFGVSDNAGDADVLFDEIEVTINRATPPQIKVLREFYDMPRKVRDLWTEEARALLRTVIGTFQTAIDGMLAVFRDKTAEDLEMVLHEFRGDTLPDEQDTVWAYFAITPVLLREWVHHRSPRALENLGTAIVLDLHCDGGEGSGVYADASQAAHVIATTNAPLQRTTAAHWGRSGVRFVGASQQYLRAADSADWRFGTGDFLIDVWLKPVSIAVTAVIMAYGGNQATRPWFIRHVNGAIQWGKTASTVTLSAAAVLSTSVQRHVRIYRIAGTVSIEVDNVVAASGADATNYGTGTGQLFIGSEVGQTGGTTSYNGDLDEIVIMKGTVPAIADRPEPWDSPAVIEAEGPEANLTLAWTQAHHSVRATARFPVGLQVNAQGFSGFYLSVSDGVKDVRLALASEQTSTAGVSWFYVLASNGPFSSASLFVEIGRRWHLNATAEHTVELHLFAPDWVLVVIDDQIVDRVPYSSFGSVTDEVQAEERRGRFVWAWMTPPDSSVLLRDARYRVQQCDQSRRSFFLQSLMELGFMISGCERNDELELWKHHTWGVNALRGTTRGIILETMRLACSSGVTVLDASSRIDWFLELTYPEVTPIFLEARGVVQQIVVEFGFDAVNYTLQELADYLVRRVFPASAYEFRYYAAFASTLTGASSVIGGSATRLPIPAADTGYWAVGDEVTVRNAGNTASDTATVVVVGATSIDVAPVTSHTYAASDVVRKVLAHS